MVGVTKKEVSQMTKYYLKMDNIMKNMFVVALNDELQAQSEQDECLEETKALLKNDCRLQPGNKGRSVRH